VHIEMIDLRQTPCPICGEKKFAHLGHAVQHVESGYCAGCRGQENARLRIYNFAQQQFGGQLRITDRSGYSHVPDHPYRCSCDKTFRQLSSLIQHKNATGHSF
jgi:ribosomal protein L37E